MYWQMPGADKIIAKAAQKIFIFPMFV
jgi:hypothetical protein